MPVYGKYGAHLRYVMVSIYGMQSYGAGLREVWCPFTVRHGAYLRYAIVRCRFVGSMVPIYGILVAGAKLEREKTVLIHAEASFASFFVFRGLSINESTFWRMN